MYALEICVGSSCHLKGSYEVINELKRLLKKYSLDDRIELKGCFCLAQCTADGVSLRINGKIFTAITKENAEDFVKNHLIAQILKQEER